MKLKIDTPMASAPIVAAESAPQCPAMAVETMPMRYGDVRDDIRERDAQYFAVHGHNGCKDKAKAANLRSVSLYLQFGHAMLLSRNLDYLCPDTLILVEQKR